MGAYVPGQIEFVKTIFESYIKSNYEGQLPLPDSQYRELKNAFYAAVYSTLIEIVAVSVKLPEEQSTKVLDRMLKECEGHSKEMLDRWYKRY